MNTFLILETSGNDSFLALCKGDECVESVMLPQKEQSKLILPATRKLLNTHKLKLSALQFIAVGTGPGSFTGTRVGVMLAKTLSFASQIPLVTFCSLSRFTPSTDGRFLTLVDGKSAGIFCLKGEKNGPIVTFEKHPFILSPINGSFESKKDFVLSPDQEKLATSLPKQHWAPASLNLNSLAKRLNEQFESGRKSSHTEAKVTYLH